jgi:hypothetical protein
MIPSARGVYSAVISKRTKSTGISDGSTAFTVCVVAVTDSTVVVTGIQLVRFVEDCTRLAFFTGAF